MRQSKRMAQFVPETANPAPKGAVIRFSTVARNHLADKTLQVLLREHRESKRALAEPTWRIAVVPDICIDDPRECRRLCTHGSTVLYAG